MDALNRYFESNQCEEILNSVKKHLKQNVNEISNIIDDYLKYINTKREKIKLDFEIGEKDHRKINKRNYINF